MPAGEGAWPNRTRTGEGGATTTTAPGRTPSDDSPPPGAGVLNSDTAGLSAAENPVLEPGRTAGEVLADEVLLERDDPDARRAGS